MDVSVPQLMRYVICYNNLVVSIVFNHGRRLRKGLVFYFKSNGIIALRKHVNANHGLFIETFENELNDNMKSSMKRQITKKGMQQMRV